MLSRDRSWEKQSGGLNWHQLVEVAGGLAMDPKRYENIGDRAHTKSMNDITRHELDAKLEAIEARMDGRVASIEGKIDAFLAAQAVRDAAQVERNQGFDRAIGEIKSGISSMKTTVIVTAISAVLAIVFGIVTFNATLSSNMLAAFQAGKAEAVTARPSPTESAVDLPPGDKSGK